MQANYLESMLLLLLLRERKLILVRVDSFLVACNKVRSFVRSFVCCVCVLARNEVCDRSVSGLCVSLFICVRLQREQ